MNDYLDMKLCMKLRDRGTPKPNEYYGHDESMPAYLILEGISFLQDGCSIYKQRGYYINLRGGLNCIMANSEEIGSDPFELKKAVEKALNELLDAGYKFKDGQLSHP
ncbi:MAG: hypothetical protein PHP92_03620 [Candidatus Nanoarchaeia archaeon]|nr:hypothetical protein [Candidatus Nanoarchaeia archaeon]